MSQLRPSLSLRPDLHARELGLAPDLWRALADMVLETTSSGVWLIDAGQRTSYANEPMAEMLGWRPAEMIGKDLFSFMDEEGRLICQRNLSRRREGISEQHEFKFVRRDGSPMWALLATNPVYDRQHRYAGALALADDITERKREEHFLRADAELLRYQLAQLGLAPATQAGRLSSALFRGRVVEEFARAPRRRVRFSVLAVRAGAGGDSANADRALSELESGLRQSTDTSQALLEPCDILGRHENSVLLALLPEVALSQAHTIAEQALTLPRSDRSVGLYVGVAAAGTHGTSADALIHSACLASQQAAVTGAPRVMLADFISGG